MKKDLIETLTARAEQKRKSRADGKAFYVPGCGELMFFKPSQTAQLDYYERLTETKKAGELLTLCRELIYDCCPVLQDPALHAALGAADPYDTVGLLLDVAEIDRLGGVLLGWIGLIGDGAEETVKN